jgi:hypothetical protein
MAYDYRCGLLRGYTYAYYDLESLECIKWLPNLWVPGPKFSELPSRDVSTE